MDKDSATICFAATALQCNQSLSEDVKSHSFLDERSQVSQEGYDSLVYSVIVQDGAVLNFICLPDKATSCFSKP